MISSIVDNKFESYVVGKCYDDKKSQMTTTDIQVPIVFMDAFSDVQLNSLFSKIHTTLSRDFLAPHLSVWTNNTAPVYQPNNDSKDDANIVASYGPPWVQCKIDTFAILRMEWEENKGIELFKILEIYGEENETDIYKQKFSGIEYICTTTNKSVDCLKSAWNLIPKKSNISCDLYNWSVICYFPALKTNRKFPQNVRRDVNAEHQLSTVFEDTTRSSDDSDMIS